MKILLLGTLLFISLSGSFGLMMYAGQGNLPAQTSNWPQKSHLAKSSAHHLVMFLHPGCACSKASLSELSRLMSEHQNLTAQVVFMKSAKIEKLFSENELVKKAKLLPRTKIVFDLNGAESKLFKAETSGLTHLYQNEELLFSGGLTQARGHEGESAGKDSIRSHLKGIRSIASSLVYGCDIFNKIGSKK